MMISAINQGQNKTKFSGYKIITNNLCNPDFQLLIKASQKTMERLGKKFDVKLSFLENYYVSPDGNFVNKLNSFVRLQIREIDESKNKLQRFLNKIFKKTFKVQAVIPEEMYKIAAEDKSIDNTQSINKWLRNQEIKYIQSKAQKQK